MFENYPALLVTKLHVPRLRASHISRDQLLAALESGLDRKLILVEAAAGLGKTTLVAEWASQHADNICWLSLDEGDNDPARFLSYVVAAIQTLQPGIGQELLAALQSPQPPPIENALHVLINQLATISDPLILVLDDYHVIENQAIHAALAFLLDHLPPLMTIVLLTRTDPPLPLARLRAKNDLLELRAAALRFSIDEASDFLNQTLHLSLSEQTVRVLDTRTEGWIAGLQLAGIAMQVLPDDRERFVQGFTGTHHFVLDYLIMEVLSHQPEDVRRFLLHTSILRQLNGALCTAVTGEADGQAMLEHLERNNLFLVPLDQSRRWYRYHHLFADLLQARLQAEDPAALNDLRRKAAQWHAENNFAEEAVTYALEAQDFAFAAELITGPAASVAQRGEVMTVLNWYRAFPADFIASQPRLSLYFGLAFALGGQWEAAETLLGYTEQNQGIATPQGEAFMLSYLVANYRHDHGKLDQLAQAAAALAQPDRLTKLVLALLESMHGNWQTACRLMSEVQEASEREGDLPLAFTALFQACRLHVLGGNMHESYRLSHEALRRIHDIGGTALPMATFAHSSLGRIMIEWNDLESAEQHLIQAIKSAESSGFVTGTVSSGTIMLAEVKQAQGDSEGARIAAELAIAHAQRFDPESEVEWLKAYQARLWLLQGNVQAAADWLHGSQQHEQSVSMFYPSSIQTVTKARLLLLQRKAAEAITVLTRLLQNPHDLLTVEAFAILALARQSQGDTVHAIGALEQALALAEVENRLRAFLDLGYPMAKLLARFCETNPANSFARQLLALFPKQAEDAQTIEPFSDRELEVLRLIVAGQSNDEIAQTLTIALSTVKWYINTLYSKLRVKTRSQAIARIHDLKLFAD